MIELKKTDSIRISSQQQIINILKKTDKRNLIFWVGAGIDKVSPTKLPLGNELLSFFLTQTCGKEYSKNLLDLWEINKGKIDEFKITNNSFGVMPRLETIINELLSCEHHLKISCSFVKGLQSFLKAPLNIIHFILAEMISHGANIITTNYDLCIQRAFSVNYGSKFEFMLDCLESNSGLYVYRSSFPQSGRIFHLHGVSNNIEDLGVSIEQVKSGLNKSFEKQMDEWLDKKYCFIFLGYGGQDSFDINRYFLSRIKDKKNKSTGIYVHHIDNSNDTRPPFSEKENILLGPFIKKYIIYAKTVNFVRKLSTKKYVISNDIDFNWEREFLLDADLYPENVKQTLIVGICRVLGINVEKITKDVNWAIKADQMDLFCDWYIIYACFAMSSIQANLKLLDKYTKRLKIIDRPNFINAEYYSSRRKYKDCIQYIDDISKITNDLKRKIHQNELIDWSISTPLNQHFKYILTDILDKYDDLGVKLIKHQSDVNQIISCSEIIRNLNFNMVSEIKQICVSQRDIAILLSIYNDNFEYALGLLDDSTYYYCEISSPEGIVGNLFAYALVNTFKFHYINDKKYFDLANEYYYNAKQLIEVNDMTQQTYILNRYIDFLKNVYKFKYKDIEC